MSNAEAHYTPVGPPIDGHQIHFTTNEQWTSFLALPIGEDPNIEVPGDPLTLKPAPLSVTTTESHGLQIEWNRNPEVTVFDFANTVDRFYRETNELLKDGQDNGFDLSISCHQDDADDPGVQERVYNFVNGRILRGVFEEHDIAEGDISTLAFKHPAGELIWGAEDRAGAVVTPNAFTNAGLGMKGISVVYEETRSMKLAPSIDVFDAVLRIASAAVIFEGTPIRETAS